MSDSELIHTRIGSVLFACFLNDTTEIDLMLNNTIARISFLLVPLALAATAFGVTLKPGDLVVADNLFDWDDPHVSAVPTTVPAGHEYAWPALPLLSE